MVCNECIFCVIHNGKCACSLCDSFSSAVKACNRDIKCAYYCTYDELKQYVYIREKLKIICEDSSYFREMMSKILDK